MKLLDKKEINFTPLVSIGQTIILIFLFLITLANSSRLGKISNSKPTLVELQDGTSIRAVAMGEKDRTDQAIMDFVGRTMMNLMSWNALPKSSDENLDPRNLKIDPGIQIADKKVTTNTWNSGFALSEDFRASFLREIAALTPSDVFNGETQSTLVVRYLAPPLKLSDGQWRIDMVANLVVFKGKDQSGKGISFNKTIFVRAVDTPPLPNNPSKQQLAAYNARIAGMEIYRIQDVDLGR
ncbi:hypothetical protein H6G41_28990 [Tolypothrix sp. FACHB-123]|uniref:hypothetical protein n=1 Tax=Tolypothrix sp. FACHB-123 TaxID=2692868 RepID=UPI001682A4F6|nr:hypothetical protein [Tolypothrix sp. FACHB-123]MBD2358597.1 hypothetical protein [Tolypothrix sp. FACHB-123]